LLFFLHGSVIFFCLVSSSAKRLFFRVFFFSHLRFLFHFLLCRVALSFVKNEPTKQKKKQKHTTKTWREGGRTELLDMKNKHDDFVFLLPPSLQHSVQEVRKKTKKPNNKHDCLYEPKKERTVTVFDMGVRCSGVRMSCSSKCSIASWTARFSSLKFHRVFFFFSFPSSHSLISSSKVALLFPLSSTFSQHTERREKQISSLLWEAQKIDWETKSGRAGMWFSFLFSGIRDGTRLFYASNPCLSVSSFSKQSNLLEQANKKG